MITTTKTERPVLFAADMVRAIESGIKTQTRRTINRIPGHGAVRQFRSSQTPGYDYTFRCKRGLWQDYREEELLRKCPYGQPGDRLWVRESFWTENETCDHDYCGGCDAGPSCLEYEQRIDYVATPTCRRPPAIEYEQTVAAWTAAAVPGHWWLAPPNDWDGLDEEAHKRRGVWEFHPWHIYTKRPSIHMPRWASRILLEVTDVRIAPLLSISDADAIAEGIKRYGDEDCYKIYTPTTSFGTSSPVKSFASLWDSINGDGAWESNPWTWAVSFQRVE